MPFETSCGCGTRLDIVSVSSVILFEVHVHGDDGSMMRVAAAGDSGVLMLTFSARLLGLALFVRGRTKTCLLLCL